MGWNSIAWTKRVVAMLTGLAIHFSLIDFNNAVKRILRGPNTEMIKIVDQFIFINF